MLHRVALALAAVLVVAACGGDTASSATDPSVPEATGVPATREPASDTTTAAPPRDAAPTTAAPTTTAAPATSSPDGPRTSPPPEPSSVGAFATFYLRPSESERILLDVHSQAGAAPNGNTLGHLASVLESVSGKRVTATQGSLEGGARQWTAADIRALADAVAPEQARARAVLTMLYLRGELAGSDNVMGVAVRSDVAAVFSDKVDEAAGVLGNRAAIEDAVSLHEVGHILGLVDLVLDTGREDPEHPGHSPNRESVMYYAVESTLIGTLLDGGPPREFDQADLDDLARIRSG